MVIITNSITPTDVPTTLEIASADSSSGSGGGSLDGDGVLEGDGEEDGAAVYAITRKRTIIQIILQV